MSAKLVSLWQNSKQLAKININSSELWVSSSEFLVRMPEYKFLY
jgi:hypothetical protein